MVVSEYKTSVSVPTGTRSAGITTPPMRFHYPRYLPAAAVAALAYDEAPMFGQPPLPSMGKRVLAFVPAGG